MIRKLKPLKPLDKIKITYAPKVYRIKEFIVPDGDMILYFNSKKDFLNWVGEGGSYYEDNEGNCLCHNGIKTTAILLKGDNEEKKK